MTNSPGFSSAPLPIALTSNGEAHQLAVEPRTTLLDLLREDLGLMGTKKGCDHGQCGACTVLLDGQRRVSCLCLAAGDELSALQQAFLDYDAFQCGYCTPGQLCSAQGLLHEGHARTREEVRELMSGNLCRCGAYLNITNAILSVLQQDAAA